MTYGAGGSTRQRTHEVVTWVRRETGITPMAHLTCAGTAAQGGPDPGGLPGRRDRQHPRPRRRSARDEADRRRATTGTAELVEDVGPPVSASASPRTLKATPSPSRAEDRRQLAAKLARADFAITQFFFERDHYLRLVDEVAAFGVTSRSCPGSCR